MTTTETRIDMAPPAAPSTWVREADAPGGTQPPVRRRIGGATLEDRFVGTGSVLAAIALSWVICFRLLPWGTVPGFAIVTFVLFLTIVSVATSAVADAPRVLDRLMASLISGGALLVGVALASTVIYTLYSGWSAVLHPNMFVDDMAGVGPRDPLDQGGVAHAILGSVIEVGLAILVAVPLGFGTAVFMTEVGGRFAMVVRTVVEAMTALPSIVAGLFIYTVFIVALGVPRSGVAAAAALFVMMLPIIARAADVVLRVIPSGLREASLALGSSRWRTVWHVVLPTARPGLATAMILGVARGVGETSPVLLTSGAASFFVVDPTGGVMNSLPLFIFSAVRSGEPGLIARGYGAAFILLGLVLLLFVAARRIARTRRGR